MLFNPNGKPISTKESPEDLSERGRVAMWVRMNSCSPQEPKALMCVNKKCPSRKPTPRAFTIPEVGMIASRSSLDPEALNISITCPACGTELGQVTGLKPAVAPSGPRKVVPFPPKQ